MFDYGFDRMLLQVIHPILLNEGWLMPDQPFPPGGADAEEPQGPAPMPSRGDGSPTGPDPSGQEETPPEEAGQGLFMCVPAGPAGLAGFAAGDAGAVET